MLGSLVRVYGAITFYLEHEDEVDDYTARQIERWEELRKDHPLPERLKTKIDAARRELEMHRK